MFINVSLRIHQIKRSAIFKLAYNGIASYTLYSTLFMLWKFAAVRRLVLNDLYVFTGYRIPFGAEPVLKRLTDDEVRRKYFDYFAEEWK